MEYRFDVGDTLVHKSGLVNPHHDDFEARYFVIERTTCGKTSQDRPAYLCRVTNGLGRIAYELVTVLDLEMERWERYVKPPRPFAFPDVAEGFQKVAEGVTAMARRRETPPLTLATFSERRES